MELDVEKLQTGVWCEIITDGYTIQFHPMIENPNGVYTFVNGPVELPIGRTSITFYVDGKAVLHHNPLYVEITPWCLVEFWEFLPTGAAPGTVAPGMNYFTGTTAMLEQLSGHS